VAGRGPRARKLGKDARQPGLRRRPGGRRFLKRELGALLPAAGWLSEETADDPERLGKDLIWLVDPIDGTRDFIRGRAAGRCRSRWSAPGGR
jgi:myo-inositol-1(or 4)-monophosphatase